MSQPADFSSTTPANFPKSPLGWRAVLLTAVLAALCFVIPQFLLAPRPPRHPLFPYITLWDRYLPFFNRAGFHDNVFAWYALDDVLAEAWSRGDKHPLGEITPETFGKIILTSPKDLSPAQKSSLEIPSEDPLVMPLNINPYGFRGDDIAFRKKPGRLRVVAAGDSLTFGFGIPDGKTWVDGMRHELGKASTRDIEVINAGVISFDSVLGAELIRKKILPLQPDWVILGYGFNDYNFNNRSAVQGHDLFAGDYWTQQIRKRQSLAGQIGYAVGEIRLVQLAQTPLLEMSQRRRAEKPFSFDDRVHYLQSIQGKHSTSRENYEKNMDDLIAELQARQIHVLLLQSNITSPYYEEGIAALATKHNLPSLNFRQTLLAALDEDDTVDLKAPASKVLFRVEVPKSLVQDDLKVYLIGDYFSAVELGASPMNDRGENGDRVADDLIYSTEVPIAPGTLLSFRFALQSNGKVTEEFGGWRIFRRFEVRQSTTPIYHFDRLDDYTNSGFALHPLMAEICHPNVHGHAVLAKAMSETLIKQITP